MVSGTPGSGKTCVAMELHSVCAAGVAAKAHERLKAERLCRYITRPPVAETRLSLTENGKIRYELKTPYRNGKTHIICEPLDFMDRSAALVLKPRVKFPSLSPFLSFVRSRAPASTSIFDMIISIVY
jgi:hypothetical protein